MCLKLGRAKFQRSSKKGTFSNSELNGRVGVRKCVSTKNWPYLGNGERHGQGYY